MFEAAGLAGDAIVSDQRENVRESVTPGWLLQPGRRVARTNDALAWGVQKAPV